MLDSSVPLPHHDIGLSVRTLHFKDLRHIIDVGWQISIAVISKRTKRELPISTSWWYEEGPHNPITTLLVYSILAGYEHELRHACGAAGGIPWGGQAIRDTLRALATFSRGTTMRCVAGPAGAHTLSYAVPTWWGDTTLEHSHQLGLMDAELVVPRYVPRSNNKQRWYSSRGWKPQGSGSIVYALPSTEEPIAIHTIDTKDWRG